MGLREQISDFFCDLCKFVYKKYLGEHRKKYDTEQYQVLPSLMHSLATQLMDSYDLDKLSSGLIFAKEFLSQDVLVDSMADGHTRCLQLEENARLLVHVNDLLKLPALVNIKPKFDEIPPPMILQLNAFQLSSEKNAKILDSLTIGTKAFHPSKSQPPNLKG